MSTGSNDIRRLIYGGSTRTGTLSTADLEWFYTNHADVWLAAAQAADAEAAVNGGKASKAVGDLKIEYRSAADGYGAVAERLRLRSLRSVAPFAGAVTQTDVDREAGDSERPTMAFRRGMHENAWAGDPSEAST